MYKYILSVNFLVLSKYVTFSLLTSLFSYLNNITLGLS
jgi:hypothetical protein